MSGSNLERSAAIPIPKKYNSYGYSISQKSPPKYLFELKLGLSDGNYITVRKIDENRYTNLLNNDDNINYENIVSYSIHVSLIPDDIETIFTNTGTIQDNCMSFFSNQDNNVYIEFNKLNNGKATCTCRYIDYNNLGLSISPPF